MRQRRNGSRSENRRPRVVVLVRAHFVSDKLLDLLRMLREGVGYDLRVCADETEGPLDLPSEIVLGHSAQMCSDLGLVGTVPDDRLLWYFGDYAFYCAFHDMPDYDYYVMIEYDVEFVRGNVYALESLIRRLSIPGNPPYDLVATHYAPGPPFWGWCETCRGRFKKCYGIFFPLVVLSKRALRYLFDWRRHEAANPPKSGRYVFCEAFIPSALMAAGGYRCADLESLLPGSWDGESFRATHPMLLGALPPLPRAVEVVHPVYSEREFLASELSLARQNNSVAELVARVSDPNLLPLSQELRDAFLSELAESNGSRPVRRARKQRRAKAPSGEGVRRKK
ncbi:MAG: hypothetical protein ACLPWF_33075 [Bryobacteraceae bacterium]